MLISHVIRIHVWLISIIILIHRVIRFLALIPATLRIFIILAIVSFDSLLSFLFVISLYGHIYNLVIFQHYFMCISPSFYFLHIYNYFSFAEHFLTHCLCKFLINQYFMGLLILFLYYKCDDSKLVILLLDHAYHA